MLELIQCDLPNRGLARVVAPREQRRSAQSIVLRDELCVWNPGGAP